MSDQVRFTAAVRAVIWLDVFFGGAILMALEIMAFRVIGKSFGSALRETSTVIAVFLAAMSIGYYVGGRVGDRFPRARTLALALVLAAFCAMIVPSIDRAISPRVFASTLPLSTHAGVVSIVLFFLPTLLLASLSPIGVRLFIRDAAHTGAVAGKVSAVSTIGSIVGSLASAFFLLDIFQSVSRTIYVLAASSALLGLLTIALNRGVDGESRPARFAAGVGALLAAFWLGSAFLITPLSPSVDYGHRIVFEADSPYHHIVVRHFNRTRNLYFDRQLQSSMKVDDEFGGGAEYTRYFHLAAAFHPEIRDVLFIGTGGGTGPKEFAHDYPAVRVTAVDVDPMVLDVAKRFFHLKSGERLRTVVADGRTFVKRTPDKFDLVVIDAYTTNRYGSTIPAHLTTREYFREVKSILKPGGIVVYNCGAAPEEVLTRAMSKTLLEVFPSLAVFTSGRNSVLFASERDLKSAVPTLQQKVKELRAAGRIRHPELERFAAHSVPFDANQYLGVPLLTDDYAPVDTLMRSAQSRRATRP